MKNQINIESLITKFLNNEALKEDLLRLETELKNTENIETLKKLIRVNYLGNTLMEKFDTEKAKRILKKKIKKNKHIVYLKKAIAIASIIVFGLLIFKNLVYGNKNKNIITISNVIKPGVNKAILTLENGQNLTLEENKKLELPNSSIAGKQIVYKNTSTCKKKDIIYNYLTIPRGGQYFLTLSDGTKVWLNSETKIKYPVKFAHNSLREVHLIYGEAYFDVSPSTRHKGAKFKVTTKNQNLIVYGTEFNVKAYNEDNFIYTTLIEGSVTISNSRTTKKLIPGTQSIVDNDKILIKNNVDVIYETAWKNGMFMFYKERLEDMLNSLSRWYNVEIEYKNDGAKDEVFSGLLKRTDNIEELLTLIEKTQTVKFTINQNKITVKQIN